MRGAPVAAGGAVIADGLLIDPRAPEHGDRPIGFVNLAAAAGVGAIALPPWPVIGLGPRDHPLARTLDAVCEPPFAPAALAAGASASPNAAAIAAQLLRAIDGLPADRALPLESLAYATLQGGAEHRRWLAARPGPRPGQRPGPAGPVRMEREGDRLRVTLDRPEALNAIDAPMRDGLRAAFAMAALDPAIARIDLRATGRAFSIGGDLGEFGTTLDPAAAHAIRMRALPAAPLAAIAGRTCVHVQGACVGAGIEMAAFASRITADARAWFQLPELAMGLIPGAGGCVSVPRRIGRGRTLLLLLSGRRIGAAAARAWGLVDAIVDEPPVDPGRDDTDAGEIATR